MNKRIHRTMYSAGILFFSCSIFAWSNTAHSAVAPVVSTLSSITEGVSTPVRLAADQSGNLFVTDPRSGGVLKYNSAGTLLQKISTASKKLLGISIAQNGNILVSQGSDVVVYSSTGAFISSFSIIAPGETDGTANGITVDDVGNVYVVDSKNNNVKVYGPTYSFISKFGLAGNGNGQFNQPTGISFEKISKQLAVTDTRNGRVQFFSTDGTFQKAVGSFGSGPLKFTSPQAISFEYSADGSTLNRMYVVDSFQANVQVIDAATSTFLSYIGTYGTRGGQMVTPGDILLDRFNRLIIPNGTGTLVAFGIENVSSVTPPNDTATTFPVPSTGTNPPALILGAINPITQYNVITVSGTSTAGAIVSVSGTTISTTADSNGNWTLNSIPLTRQGLNNIIITATNSGGTSGTSAYITLDTAAPVVTTSSAPPTGSTTNTPIQTIFGSVTDTTATSVTVAVSGSNPQTVTVPVNYGLFTATIILGSGANTVTVTTTDAAGNLSLPAPSTVTYNPLAPVITVATPGGAVTGTANYTVTGTAAANNDITVNGVPAAKTTATQWTATIPLQAGTNQITVVALINGTPVSTISSSVTYAPGQPTLAITSPAVDSATAQASPVISGTASKGTSVTASLGGAIIPVSAAPDGTFTISVPPFTNPGTYPITITAIDTNGKMSTTTRSFVYDPAPPIFTVVAEAPAIKVNAGNGVVIAKDKNGIIVTPNNSNGTGALDLTAATGVNGAPIDMDSLNIQTITRTGLSSRNGDITGDGNVDIADALRAANISLGATTATFEEFLRGDVGPVANHSPAPDGKIRLIDVILILQKSVGINW